jgi:hypothetical protein
MFSLPPPQSSPPERFIVEVPDRHARHQCDEPAVRRLGPQEGGNRRPPHRFSYLQRRRRGRSLRLFYLQERGALFVSPGNKVYVGMILGEHNRGTDLDVNPIKEKKLTNIRAAGKDDAMLLTPPRKMTLEQAIAYIEDDELVEVTSGAVRLRKRWLDRHERKRHERRVESEAA